MAARREDELFELYRKSGDPDALGEVFDLIAPKLLHTALHLARDPAGAEDLLQATFLTVIRKAESFDARRPLLPWLTGILSRQAARVTEAEGRRPDPARLGKRTAADPAVDAENKELVGLLRQGLEGLPGEYRQVLLLRLLHGLEPAEIAEVLEIPPSTVRTRLQRGLEKLRRILPVGLASIAGVGLPLRGLAAVRRSVLEKASIPTSSLVPIGAALTMKKILLPVALATGLAALWLVWPGIPPIQENRAAGEARPGPLTAELSGTEQVPGLQGGEETDMDRIAVEELDAPTTGALILRVLREADDRPLEHVGVHLTPRGQDSLTSLRQASTGSDGTARFEDLPLGDVQVVLDRGPREVVTIRAGPPTELTVHVGYGIAVEGRVLDQNRGPVPFASIWVDNRSPRWSSMIVGKADAYGAFRLEDLSQQSSVGATAPGHAPSWNHEVRGDPGDTLHLDLVLEGIGASLRGRIVDGSGAPVGHALLVVKRGQHKQTTQGTLSGWSPRRVRAAEDGTFLVEGLPSGWVGFWVRATGHAPRSESIRLDEGMTHDITVRLGAGADLSGTVRNSQGVPVPGAKITVNAYGPHESMLAISGADGSYRLQGVSIEHIQVEVSAEGYASQSDELRTEAGTVLQWDVELVRVPLLNGRLLGPAGEPLVGWRVTLEFNHSGARTTDREGRFRIHFETPEPQAMRIARSDWGGWIPCTWLGDVEPREEALDIVIPEHVMPQSRIRGRFLDATGTPVRYGSVSLSHERWWAGSFPIDPTSGDFDIGPLPAGSYWLSTGRWADEGAPVRLGPYEIENKVVLDLGDIQIPEPGQARIRVRHENGGEIVELVLFLFDSTGHELGPLLLDETGTSIAPLTPGDYVAHAWARNGTSMRRPFTIDSREETRLDLVLEPAVRRYVSFPVPEPDGWGEPKEVRFAIRDAGGMVFDESYFEPRDFMPFRYMPAFAVGRYTLELTLDDGRRFQGVFGVPDLHPSDESITVSVTPIR